MQDRSTRLATTSPYVEGTTATFRWHGPRLPRLEADINRWGIDPVPFEPDGHEMWSAAVDLPADAYVEYHLSVDGANSLDPLNRRSVPNGIGGRENFFYMPEAGPTPYLQPGAGARLGRISRHEVEDALLVVGGRRTVYLYHPPVDEPCPLLVVLDGGDYLRRGRLNRIVDTLIARRLIRPIALAFVQNGGQARYVEYMCNDAHLGFITRRVLPLARERLPLVDVGGSPGPYGMCGASMGGLMALYAGVRLPGVFGNVLSQSGGFRYEIVGERTVVADLIRQGSGSPVNVYMDVGRFERYLTGLLESNQHMRDLLLSYGYSVTYRERNSGHNMTAWRDAVALGLQALFPPA